MLILFQLDAKATFLILIFSTKITWSTKITKTK